MKILSKLGTFKRFTCFLSDKIPPCLCILYLCLGGCRSHISVRCSIAVHRCCSYIDSRTSAQTPGPAHPVVALLNLPHHVNQHVLSVPSGARWLQKWRGGIMPPHINPRNMTATFFRFEKKITHFWFLKIKISGGRKIGPTRMVRNETRMGSST